MLRIIAAAAAILFGTAVLSAAMILPVGSGSDIRVGPTVKVMTNGGSGWGSGVHIGNGFILTAAHVVNNALDIKIKFDDQSIVKDVETMWVNTRLDIALLRIGGFERVESRNLNCTDPVVGTKITIEGNPMEFEFVTTYGFVTSTIQPVTWPMGSGNVVWPLAYAVDAEATPGNSGGPVYNEAGEVVGFLVGRIPNEDLRFAVPASVACSLLGRV